MTTQPITDLCSKVWGKMAGAGIGQASSSVQPVRLYVAIRLMHVDRQLEHPVFGAARSCVLAFEPRRVQPCSFSQSESSYLVLTYHEGHVPDAPLISQDLYISCDS